MNPYYYKEQKDNIPVVSQERNGAKVFEYKEDAEILADCLTLIDKSIGGLRYEAAPDLEGARFRWIVKSKAA